MGGQKLVESQQSVIAHLETSVIYRDQKGG